MFLEEKPFLGPLPTTRFEYYQILTRRVHLDGFVQLGGAYYGLPTRYAGTEVIVHAGTLWVRILDPTNHQCIREHPIVSKGQRRTLDADRPEQTPPKIEFIAQKLAKVGPACGAFARAALTERGSFAVRTLLGVLNLLRHYEVTEIERACELAATAQSWRLRFLRAYLDRNATPKKLTNDHPVIPGLERYVTHFSIMSKGDSP